jgi:hypothetical protein
MQSPTRMIQRTTRVEPGDRVFMTMVHDLVKFIRACHHLSTIGRGLYEELRTSEVFRESVLSVS